MQAILDRMTTAGMREHADGRILAAKSEGIGFLVFNQPAKLNAMSVEMWDGVHKVLSDFETDAAVRVVVLAGAGEKAFVSGGDISQFEKVRSNADANAEFARLTGPGRDKLATFPKPKIAAIRGWCLGGGLAVAMATDLRIAAVDSTFGIPAARLSIAYGRNDIKRLIDLVGAANARMILYTARRYPAREAERMGLVNQVVENDQLVDTVLELAQTIGNNAPLSVAASKITIDELLKDPAERNDALIAAQTTICMNSADYAEGRRAFMEKRPPQFTGK